MAAIGSVLRVVDKWVYELNSFLALILLADRYSNKSLLAESWATTIVNAEVRNRRIALGSLASVVGDERAVSLG